MGVPERPEGIDNYATLAAKLTEHSELLATLRSLHQRASTDYSELEELLHSIGTGAAATPEQLERKCEELNAQIAALEVDPTLLTVVGDPQSTLTETNEVLPSLVEAMQQLPDNSRGEYSREALEQTRAEYETATQTLESLTKELRHVHVKLEHYHHTQDQQCPQCQYRWKPGLNPQDQALLETQQQTLQTHYDAVKQQRALLEQRLESFAEYNRTMGTLRSLFSSYQRLRPLAQRLHEERAFTERPAERIGLLYAWQRDLRQLVEYTALVRERDHLEDLRRKQEQLGEINVLVARQEKLQRELQDYGEQQRTVREKLETYKQFNARYLHWLTDVDTLKQLLSEGKQLYRDAVEALRNEGIDSVVSRHHDELALTQRKLTEHGALSGIVSDLERDYRAVELDWKALQVLTQALSPTEGLIAEQLTGFIQCLVAQINSVIASVWSYDLKVLSCGLDGTELDYKFPLQVGTGDSSIDDIGYGSTAQVEIINLAFKLTVMLYMGLTDYPLYLDELGAGFDEQHRINVMNFIKQLMDVNQHSQMFLISHYAASWGVFADAQILVLDSGNISLPQDYNKHVSID